MAQRFRNFNFLGRIWMMSEDNDFKVKNLDGYAKKNFFYYANKRIFDVLGGLIGLTISAIPIAIFAVIIKKDGGPAFYTQRRIGLHGKSIFCRCSGLWVR